MELYQEALEEAGFQVERIKDAKTALEYIQSAKQSPDLWIVDLMMPVEDEHLRVDGKLLLEVSGLGLTTGLVLYRQIRNKHPSAKVLILTNMAISQIFIRIQSELGENASIESKLLLLPSELARLALTWFPIP